jgi:hypothetical protein
MHNRILSGAGPHRFSAGLDSVIVLHYYSLGVPRFHPKTVSAMATRHSHPVTRRRAEPVSVSPSILRMSAAERLGVVAVVVAALWAAVHWAVS